MMQDNTDIFKWLTGLLIPAVGWLWKTVWDNSKDIAKMSTASDSSKSKIDELASKFEDSQDRCSALQKDLADRISASLQGAFENLLSRATLASTKELAEINKNIAIMTDRYENLSKTVSDLAAKVNKGTTIRFVNPNDNGQRRRCTDSTNGDSD